MGSVWVRVEHSEECERPLNVIKAQPGKVRTRVTPATWQGADSLCGNQGTRTT